MKFHNFFITLPIYRVLKELQQILFLADLIHSQNTGIKKLMLVSIDTENKRVHNDLNFIFTYCKTIVNLGILISKITENLMSFMLKKSARNTQKAVYQLLNKESRFNGNISSATQILN